MAAPEEVSVWVGLDVGTQEHFADVLDNAGERLFARAVASDQAGLEALLDRAARHGTPGLVIDQPGSIAQLALAVAARRGTSVAYVAGLVMRRAAGLCPDPARTERAVGERLHRGRVRGLLTQYPTLTALRAASQSRIEQTVRARSPRIAARVTAAVAAALAAQDVTVPAEASLRDPASEAFCDRKRAEGKRHNAALICLARRRCAVILAMIGTGQPCTTARKPPRAGLSDAA